jgi:hypothetical protein
MLIYQSTRILLEAGEHVFSRYNLEEKKEFNLELCRGSGSPRVNQFPTRENRDSTVQETLARGR